MTDTNNTAPAATPAPVGEPQAKAPVQIQVGRTSLAQNFDTPKPQAPAPKEEPAKAPEEAPKEELILGKFKSQDDLAAAYKELEKKLGQPKEAPKEEPKEATGEKKAEGEAEGEKPPQDPQQPEEVKDEAGQVIDVARYEQEFVQNKALSEETYKELAEKHKLPKDVVDDFIQMRMDRAEQVKQAFLQAGGGEENVKTIIEWASSSDVDPGIANAYNKAIDSAKTKEDVVLAIQGLRSQYEAAKGVQPRRIVGENASGLSTGGSSTAGFESEAEFSKARRDPRYAKDPVYRTQVNERLARSAWFQSGNNS